MATFYTGVDKERYDAGNKFLPMDQFLLNYTAPKTNVEEVTTSYGIPSTNAFTYSGGDQNYYPGKTSNLVSNFNREIQAYNERVKEGNRPLREAQFPAFPQATTPGGLPANAMYNLATKDINDPFNRLAMSSTFPTRTAKEVQDYANEALLSHQEKARTGQFGPSYIEAEKPTLKRRISDFAYDHIPGINRPQSYEDIMTKGYIQPRGMIPGIMGIMSNFGLKNYASLPQADQAFIASKRGYKGPTIFGDQGNMEHSVDPFGKNIESLFGNYAEYSKKESARLDKQIDKSQKSYVDKYGSLDDENEYGKTWYEMNNLNLARQSFYKQNVTDTQNIGSDLSLIEKNEAAEKARDAKIADETLAKTGGTEEWGEDMMGGTDNDYGFDDSGGFIGEGWANGGRVGLRYGGLARLL